MWFIGRSRLTKWLAASRKPEGPVAFAPNPSGFDFVRWLNIGFDNPLDLVHEFLSGRTTLNRQNLL
ncbi:hypothetical protein DEV91_10284 [Phyllobacterium brassicacearum]|nr:hypothetical protein DEV91_10284 [Phyllobacterium brassicacearum]